MKVFIRWLALAVSAVLLIVGMLAGTAGAAAETVTYEFDGCTGPDGTPPKFTAEKTATPEESGSQVSAASAFRLTDGSAIYTVYSFGEGNFSPPGISHSASATVECNVDFDSGTARVAGKLAPAP